MGPKTLIKAPIVSIPTAKHGASGPKTCFWGPRNLDALNPQKMQTPEAYHRCLFSTGSLVQVAQDQFACRVTKGKAALAGCALRKGKKSPHSGENKLESPYSGNGWDVGLSTAHHGAGPYEICAGSHAWHPVSSGTGVPSAMSLSR